MRKVVPWVAGTMLGGIAAGVVLFVVIGNLVVIRVEVKRGPTNNESESGAIALPETPQQPDVSKSLAPPTSQGGDQARQIVDRGNQLASAGQLREAQELYLQVLFVNPEDREAMRGLVRARRLLANEDAKALRQQAETYRRAIAQGIETNEHYTAVAMDLLATASSLAAAEIEASSATVRARVPSPVHTVVLPASPVSPSEARPAVPKPVTTVVKPKPEPAKPEPLVAQTKPDSKPEPKTAKQPPPKPEPATIKPAPAKPKSQTPPPKPQPKPKDVVRPNVVRRPAAIPAPPKPAPVQPPPPSLAQPAQEPELPVDENEPFVTITLGPIGSAAQASSITADLTVAGYVARMRRDGAQYFITLGPYRQTVAERIASRIRARFGQGAPVSLNPSTN